MFKIKFFFKSDFHTEAKHLISIAKYETDSFIAAVFIVEAFAPCCQDYFVNYNNHQFNPQKWVQFVKANNPSDPAAVIVQPSLF